MMYITLYSYPAIPQILTYPSYPMLTTKTNQHSPLITRSYHPHQLMTLHQYAKPSMALTQTSGKK